MSHPYQFNDLMDTRPYAFDIRKIDRMTFNKLKQDAIDKNPEILNHYTFNWEGNCDIRAFDELRKYIFDSYFSFAGLSSFADRGRFNELMWSHYAKESGFMVEFDTCKLVESIKNNNKNSIFHKLILNNVKYRNSIIAINHYNDFQHLNKMITYQKNTEWKYEKEWRIVGLSNQFLGKYDYYTEEQTEDFRLRKMYYSPIAIKRIYLGKKFWTNDNYIEKDIPQDKKNAIRQYVCRNRKDIKPDISNEDIEKYKETFGKFVHCIQKLVKENDNYVYMSGATSYCKASHRIRDFFYNNFTKRYECSRSYVTRAFELIKDISIEDLSITVKYSTDFQYKDTYFDTLDLYH